MLKHQVASPELDVEVITIILGSRSMSSFVRVETLEGDSQDRQRDGNEQEYVSLQRKRLLSSLNLCKAE